MKTRPRPLLAVGFVAACAGGSGPNIPAPASDEFTVIVRNERTIDIAVLIQYFGNAQRFLGTVPAGTDRAYNVRVMDQDFLVLVAVNYDQTLGRGEFWRTSFIPGPNPRETYTVVAPPNGVSIVRGVVAQRQATRSGVDAFRNFLLVAVLGAALAVGLLVLSPD